MSRLRQQWLCLRVLAQPIKRAKILLFVADLYSYPLEF